MQDLIYIYIPEGGWVLRPVVEVVLKRVAVKSEKVPPVGNLFSLDVETGGKPGGFGRVIGVVLQPLLLWQPEELFGYS